MTQSLKKYYKAYLSDIISTLDNLGFILFSKYVTL